jgi:5-formaminoimidazole-4-carboxamide-1-(beta)-D-ribofuranosyl 5'-monophosphate synthetase
MEYKIGVLASHSALDVLDGAKEEGFKTIALSKIGREKVYKHFSNLIDKLIVLQDYKEILSNDIQEMLLEERTIIIPNRSFAVYLGYDEIETKFRVPIYSNKYMLRWEERTSNKNYYKLLDICGIRRPKVYKSIDEVDGPVIVKLPEASRKVERGFFFAVNKEDLSRKLEELLSKGLIDNEGINQMSIEEYIFGAHFNVNYFYSVIRNRLELYGIDRRIQSDLDSFLRLPAEIQLKLSRVPRMIEVGHEIATIRESLLNKVIEVGEKFLEGTRKVEKKGIIGPFTLQAMVTPELDIIVYDIATRIGGGTNVFLGFGSQYSKFYFGKPITLGRRIAIELKEAVEYKLLDELLT